MPTTKVPLAGTIFKTSTFKTCYEDAEPNESHMSSLWGGFNEIIFWWCTLEIIFYLIFFQVHWNLTTWNETGKHKHGWKPQTKHTHTLTRRAWKTLGEQLFSSRPWSAERKKQMNKIQRLNKQHVWRGKVSMSTNNQQQWSESYWHLQDHPLRGV